MNEVIRFALLGCGVGALYAFASQGLIVIFRGTGVLNFSLGATAIAGVFVQYELQYEHGHNFFVASFFGVLLSATLGVLTHWVVMRPLQRKRASTLVQLLATLGVLITVQAGVVIRYGSKPRQVPSQLPTDRVTLYGDVSITADRLILLAIGCVSAFLLWLLYRSSQFGIQTEAVSESERSAAAVGVSPNKVAALNWALGSSIACIAGILVVPVMTLQVTSMTTLVLAALAAALVGDFKSFPIATAAGYVLGMSQTLVGRFWDQQGLDQSLPFLLIILMLVFRGRSIPLRDHYLRKLPAIGNGRISWDWMIFLAGVVVFLMLTKDTKWIDALTVTLCASIVLLSIVVVTGYAGQLSLAQYAMAGFGAWVAGRLVAVFHIPFLLALVAGVAAAVPLGLVFALPAVRTRGINLAIVTLGLGTAIELMLFSNSDFTGGIKGTPVGKPNLFGFEISSIKHPARYGIFVLGMALLMVLVVANVRRGRSGRRLIAVRTNERAAAALGINIVTAKLYAFALASAIAALGGILMAFRLTSISFQSFTNFTSITYAGLSLVGGVGHLLGAFVGGMMATAGFNQEVMESTWDGVGQYIQLISGIAILLVVLYNPDGVAAEWARTFRHLKRTKKFGESYFIKLSDVSEPVDADHDQRVIPKTLVVDGLTVRYGAVTAVDKVGFTLEPGQVTGLIGPNGAGKTSLIDALTGFTRSSGSAIIDGREISNSGPAGRVKAGMVRSFQSLELFEDTTVFENISIAADPQDLGSYLRDLVWPVIPKFGPQVVRAIEEFELDQDLHREVSDLSYGKRRLLAIARAVAMHPSVLLLDEPAAGLSSVESVELARVVRRLADDWGMAILVVEHDMNFVMGVCDRVVVLDFGRMIANGTPSEVRNDPAVIAAYLGVETDDEQANPFRRPHSSVHRGRWAVTDTVSISDTSPYAVSRTPNLLETRGLKAGYLGREVVSGVNLTVRPGEVVCLLGPNGAGKSTTLLTIAGELAPVDGLVMFGNVPTFTPMYQRVRNGIGLVTEQRLVFTKMSTRDNLRIGGGSVERALELFPELRARLEVRGGMLSGGEQQMVALSRGLSRDPKLLLADELSLGLAPMIVDRLLGAVRKAADERGIGALIVEQHARKALKYSDRMYLMSRGQIRMEMTSAEALTRLDEIEEAYLAGTSESEEDHIERKRRKDVRKAWGRMRVRERELRRLTATQVSRRHSSEDDSILDRDQQRRDWQMRARRGRKY